MSYDVKCAKILGKGKFGLAYLTPQNLVVKIEKVSKKTKSFGEKFASEVVPTFTPSIKKHFIQYYDIEFVKEISIIDCDKGTNIFIEPLSKNEKFYKRTIMQYGGETLSLNDWTIKKCKECFESLLLPIANMNEANYYHYDIHINNIVYNKENKCFVLIDYGEMKKSSKTTNVDLMSLIGFIQPGFIKLFWTDFYDKRYPENKKIADERMEQIIKSKFDDSTKKDFQRNSFYMTIYYPDIFTKIFFNTTVVPKDIKAKTYNRETCMEIYDIAKNKYDPIKSVKKILRLVKKIT